MMKQEADLDSEKQIYLTCEKYYIFELLIFAAVMKIVCSIIKMGEHI